MNKMKAYINRQWRQVYLEADLEGSSLAPLAGWDIFVGQSPPSAWVENTVEVNGLYSLATAVDRGPPPSSPEPCCSCSCHCKGE
jgi:hypothetical protein